MAGQEVDKNGGKENGTAESQEEEDPFKSYSPVPEGILVENIRQSITGKSSKHSIGKAWKNEKGEYVRYRCYDRNVEYKPGDSVFIESQRPDQPYYICNITEFKRSKKDTFVAGIRWFYRTTEVPETVYNFLIKDRYTEHGENALHDPLVKSRELFISNSTDTFPVNVLRGKCGVMHCLDIVAVKQFQPKDDAFFYLLSYNPETRRLASTQGEIRVGSSHQARVPPFEGDIPPIGRPDRYEELVWEPGRVYDHDLLMYLRAARSMAAFAGMCDGGSTEDGCYAAGRDDTTANALDVLHECNYETGKALQTLVKNPVPNGLDKQWSEDETRRFIKGLRIHGKNFFKIRQEFMPEKETGELITYYYLWKKTPGASGSRPRGRRNRHSVLRRVKSTKEAGGKKKGTSSASEVEDSGTEDGEKNTYFCRYCNTKTSKDWHHGGKELKLLCFECRMYYKRYGEMPLLPGMERKEFAFRPISPNGEGSQGDGDSDGRGLDNRLSPDREESDSVRSYSSRSESGSRTPEEDIASRAATPSATAATANAGGALPQPPAGAVSSNPSVVVPEIAQNGIVDGKDTNGGIAPPPPAVASGSQLPAGPLIAEIEKDIDRSISLNGKPPQMNTNIGSGLDMPENLSTRRDMLNDISKSSASMIETSSAPVTPTPPLFANTIGAPLPPPLTSQTSSPLSTTAAAAVLPPPPPANVQSTSSSSSLPPSAVHNLSSSSMDCQPTDLSIGSIGGGSSIGGHNTSGLLLAPPPAHHQHHGHGPGGIMSPSPLNTSGGGGARTPVDLTSPSPGPHPEIQVLEPPEPSTTPSSPVPISREPSPEPRIEDVECHRSQSAIFVRHINRGEKNSCARTDLFFRPVPESKLARKREERLRRNEEKEKNAQQQMSGMGPGGSGGLRISQSLTPNNFGNVPDMDRHEREKRERELAEIRDRENRMREDMMRRGGLRPPGLLDPYLDPARRYPPGIPPPFSLGDRLTAERLAAERMSLATDPLVRLQMAGITPEVSSHSHTHLHMHPDSALMLGQPSVPGYPGLPGMPPNYRPPFGDLTAGLRPPGADYLSRLMAPAGLPGADALQRQLLLERERGLLTGASPLASSLLPPASLAPPMSLQQRQHEEYLRAAAREREMKVRTLEEAARQAGR